MNLQAKSLHDLFGNRKLVIATKHQKEEVIAPILEAALGVKCIVPENFDTDVFGTFSGEKIRHEDPISTARKKCEMAMKLTNCDIGIASEGSFGAHPHLYFVNADDEFILLIDKKNNLEIIARELSTSTNFGGDDIKTKQELLAFAKQSLFPSHGLILRKEKDNIETITKDFKDLNHLEEVFLSMQSKYGSVFIETDMRAMMNPTRMEVIGLATQRLIEKISSRCPECEIPGFSITETKSGLPCGLCGFPTQSTLYHVLTCANCEFTRREMFPNKKEKEEPMYCDNCNP
jgi:predicted Zn-ribbon and HTH transcriptional regulator